MARWLALWSIVLVAVTWRTGVPTTGQTRGAAAFEVASVKPVKPEFPLQRPFACVFGAGGRFRAFGTLQMLIACAYRIPAALNERQISGGPKWLTVDLFDIEAKSPQRYPATCPAAANCSTRLPFEAPPCRCRNWRIFSQLVSTARSRIKQALPAPLRWTFSGGRINPRRLARPRTFQPIQTVQPIICQHRSLPPCRSNWVSDSGPRRVRLR